MIRRANIVTTLIPVAVAAGHLASAQQPPTTTLNVDLVNQVQYEADISDPAKFARNANIAPSLGIGTGIANFAGGATILADIVAVNGQPVTGLYAAGTRAINAYRLPSRGRQSLTLGEDQSGSSSSRSCNRTARR